MSDLLIEAIFNGLYLAAVYALAAFGLAIVFGVLHILNFAHGAILLGGAYIAVSLTEDGKPFWLALLVGVVVMAVVGAVLEVVLFRRVEAEPISGLIISIGLIGMSDSLYQHIWGSDPHTMPRLIEGSTKIGGGVVANDRLVIIAIAATALLLAQVAIVRTGHGKLLRATAEDRDAALLQGVPVKTVKLFAFIGGAVLAAFAGIIVGTSIPVEPVLGENILIKGFIIIIIGGAGNTTGTLLGAVIIGITEAVGITYLPTVFAQLLPLLMLAVVLLVRPQGILGSSAVRV